MISPTTAGVLLLVALLTGCSAPEGGPESTAPNDVIRPSQSQEENSLPAPQVSVSPPAVPNLACELFDHELSASMGYTLFRDEEFIEEVGLSYYERAEGNSSGCIWEWDDNDGGLSFGINVSSVSDVVQEADGLWSPWSIGMTESVRLSEDGSVLVDVEGEPLRLFDVGNLECGAGLVAS